MKNGIQMERHTRFFATFSPSSFTAYNNKYHINTKVKNGCFIRALEISHILRSYSYRKTFINLNRNRNDAEQNLKKIREKTK